MFESLSTLIRILLFGGQVLLTPNTVDLGPEWLLISPGKPFSAVTEGASLHVDLGKEIDSKLNVVERMELTAKKFPSTCGTARLVATDGVETVLTIAGSAVSNTETYLLLTAKDGVPTNRRYKTVLINFSCPIKAAKVYWKNFGV